MSESETVELERAAKLGSREPRDLGVFLDAGRWRLLAEAPSVESYARVWLSLQCARIPGAKNALIVLGGESGPLAPVATWPEGADVDSRAATVADAALAQRRGVVKPADAGARDVWLLAYPVVIENDPVGVVAVTVGSTPKDDLPLLMRELQWGCAWIEAFYRRRYLVSDAVLADVLGMVALALEHESFQGAATAVVTELADHTDAHRVSIGFMRGKHVRVLALSHSAEFGEKNNLIRLLGEVMDEAADQQTVITYPLPGRGDYRMGRVHEDLARKYGARFIATVPLVQNDELIGGLTLERDDRAFARAEVEQLERTAALVGPVLNAKRLEDRWLPAKVGASFASVLRALIGPDHLRAKLLAIAAGLLAVFFTFATGDYRIAADAVLQGEIQRSVTAPIAGYVAAAHARAGDIVDAGQLLATLDERDFQLERVRWVSEKEKFRREYSRALAEGDRGLVGVLSAQIEQADAQLRLLDEQLSRTQIKAPFKGIIVSGDLSQTLGAPVERGEVIFEVAPLDSYRVILRVDEKEVSRLEDGQRGQLVLAGMPDQSFAIAVSKITPVAQSYRGGNYFRVEAQLMEPAAALRPGMEGIAKVTVGERKLIWIYTHRLLHWLRLWVWRVSP